MREQTIKIYTFDELSDEAKEKAREWWRSGECDLFSEMATDDVTDFLIYKYPFLSEIECVWRLSYGQGDGFTFTKADIDLPAFMKAEKIAGKYRALYNTAVNGEARASIEFQHTGCGNGYSVVSIHAWGGSEKADEQATTVEDELKAALRSIESEAYNYIRDDYEWQNADEQVDERILCNGYEFTEDGGIA